MFGNLSGPTLLVILFIVLLLFGAPKLPALARSLGQSMKILKKEVSSDGDSTDAASAGTAQTTATPPQSTTTAAQQAAQAEPQPPVTPEAPSGEKQ